MAEVKVIEVQIKSNLDNSTASVSKFKSGLKDATSQSKELSNSLQGTKESEFINKLGEGVGKLNPAFGSAIQGANGLLVKMWALVANPVGAILAAITVTLKFLYEAFENSIAGGKELKAIFAGISAVGDQVKDAMFGLGRSIINVTTAAYKFITLDFKGAAESMKEANREATNSYKQLGSAVDGTTAKIVYNLTKQQQANDKAKKIQAVTQSETNKLLVQSREILTDETASINAKKKALAEVTKAEQASSKEKVRIAAEDLRIIKERAKALGGEAEKKMKGEIRDATIALNEAETENAMTGIKLNKQRKMLGRQEAADIKEKNDAIAAANKEATDKRLAQEKADAAVLKAFQDDVLKNKQQMNLDKVQKEIDESIEEKDRKKKSLDDIALMVDELEASNLAKEEAIKAKKNKDIQDEIDAQKRKYEALSLITQSGMNFLAALQDAGIAKGKAGQMAMKALTLAQIGIDTASAFSNAVPMAINAGKEAAKLAGPAAPLAGPIATAASYLSSATMIVSNIAKAKRLLSSGSGSASTSSGGGGGSAPTPAAPSFNVVGASATNQLAQTIGNQQKQPIKAYVVANDVTTQQSLDRNIVQSASIG